jgi:hypothetical protein
MLVLGILYSGFRYVTVTDAMFFGVEAAFRGSP